MIDYLAKSGYTRRAQAVTWQPTCDLKTYDPPCLQRIWCRLLQNGKGDYVLNMNTHWRSRDLYKAWFMNVYALTDLQRIMAEKISEKMDKKVTVGRYVDISDSLHLYGSYFSEIESEVKKMKEKPINCVDLINKPYDMEVTDYLESIEKNLAQRTYTTDHPAFKMMTEEAMENLAVDADFYARPRD